MQWGALISILPPDDDDDDDDDDDEDDDDGGGTLRMRDWRRSRSACPWVGGSITAAAAVRH